MLKRRLFPLVCLFLFSQYSSAVKSVKGPPCEGFLRSPDDERWVDLDGAIELLDYSKISGPLKDQDLDEISESNLNRAVQARLRVVKSIFDNADKIESAQILLAHFDELSELPLKMLSEPEELDGGEEMFHLSMAKCDLYSLARAGFALALLMLANEQPFLVLNEPKVIPIIAEVLFSGPLGLSFASDYQDADRFTANQAYIAQMIGVQKNKLLSSNSLKLTAISKESIDRWQESLDLVARWRGISFKQVKEFAAKLGIVRRD